MWAGGLKKKFRKKFWQEEDITRTQSTIRFVKKKKITVKGIESRNKKNKMKWKRESLERESNT